MLLCEVALGENQGVLSDPDYRTDAHYDSVKGEGSHIPDPENTLYNTDGASIFFEMYYQNSMLILLEPS